jgi:hypothetical protein
VYYLLIKAASLPWPLPMSSKPLSKRKDDGPSCDTCSTKYISYILLMTWADFEFQVLAYIVLHGSCNCGTKLIAMPQPCSRPLNGHCAQLLYRYHLPPLHKHALCSATVPPLHNHMPCSATVLPLHECALCSATVLPLHKHVSYSATVPSMRRAQPLYQARVVLSHHTTFAQSYAMLSHCTAFARAHIMLSDHTAFAQSRVTVQSL